MSRISVIVPCHNYVQFVGEALASLEDQSRPPDEIIVVDDGSTDDSLEVIAAYAKVRDNVKVLSRSPATGVVQAVADGVAASTGDLIVFLSADDRFSPTYLEESERVLADETIDFTWTATRQFGAINRWRPAVPAVTMRSMARRCRIHACGMMRRDLWDRTGGYNPRFEALGCEDWEYWVNALSKGAVGAPVSGCHLEWRRHVKASRNRLGARRVVAVHLAIRRAHPEAVRRRDVALGLGPTLAAFGLAWLRTVGREVPRSVRSRLKRPAGPTMSA